MFNFCYPIHKPNHYPFIFNKKKSCLIIERQRPKTIHYFHIKPSQMNIPIYIVDAFANKLFSGNPAAVCPLDNWIDDDLMQNIAMENNLSETVFFVKTNDKYEIRWFTPGEEMDLCGHATLASAFVIFNLLNFPGDIIHFYSSRSGDLMVSKDQEIIIMDFPTDRFEEIKYEPSFDKCFNSTPNNVFRGKTDYMFVFDNEDQIKNMIPNLDEIKKLGGRGLIITAKGNQVDFVSRCFFPQTGVDEDPVTGSAHTTMIPYWSKIFNKNNLTAKQISKRGGSLICEYKGDRVVIGGEAKLYMIGEICMP